MQWLSVLALVLAACASGSNAPADGRSNDGPMIDGPVIDAMPQPVDLSQNSSTTPNTTQLGCQQFGYTRENSFYRVFPLADFNITGSFEVRAVTFGIAVANADADAGATGATQQPAQIKIGRYKGTAGGPMLSLAEVEPIIPPVTIQIPDGAMLFTAPIPTTPTPAVIPPGANLIVELAIPDGGATGNVFYVGTNSAGESKPGYMRASGCSIPVPTSMEQIAAQNGFPKSDLILTVGGMRY